MNKIQKDILKNLSEKELLKYSEVKPVKMEGNLFSYHLKKLVESKLIDKNDTSYSLSSSGKLFLQKMSGKTMKTRVQPNIMTLVICENRKSEYLLYKRSKQPNINKWGFPAGKIHENEPITSSVKRELFEKTGLVASPKHAGLIYLTFYGKDSNVFSSVMINVFTTKSARGDFEMGPGVSELEWINKKDLKKYDLMPEVPLILKEVTKNLKTSSKLNKIFYKEMFVHI